MTDVQYSDWEKSFDGNVRIIIATDKKILHEACEIVFAGDPTTWTPPYWPKNYKPGSLKAAWRIVHGNDEVTIYNDLPYAYRIETGWSKRAPQGMMRINLKSFNAIIDAVARKYQK